MGLLLFAVALAVLIVGAVVGFFAGARSERAAWLMLGSQDKRLGRSAHLAAGRYWFVIPAEEMPTRQDIGCDTVTKVPTTQPGTDVMPALTPNQVVQA